MTENPRPPIHQWSEHRCSVCHSDNVATVTIYGGKRCAEHPAAYDPRVATRLRLDGWRHTADAYARYYRDGDPPCPPRSTLATGPPTNG